MDSAIKKRRREEAKLQKRVLEALAMMYPEGIPFHVPNGGYRNPIEGKHLKEMGVLAGIPDLPVWRPFGQIGIIEVKYEDGPYTDSQKKLFPRIEALGHTIYTVRFIEDVQPITRQWRFEDAQIKKALSDAT